MQLSLGLERLYLEVPTRSSSQQLPLSAQGIALELFCQHHKDAIDALGPGSRNGGRSPAKCRGPAEFKHLPDHIVPIWPLRRISHSAVPPATAIDPQPRAQPLGSSKLNISA